MQYTEGLHGALVHRHLANDEIGSGSRDLYPQASFHCGGAAPVDFYQAMAALTDIRPQFIIPQS